MKFTIQSAPMSKALKPLMKVIPSKVTDPVHEYILLEACDGKVTVSVTRGEITVSTVLLATSVETEGSVLVEAKVLGGYLSSLPDIPVTFESSNNTMCLKWLNGDTSMSLLDTALFPKPAAISPDADKYTVDAQTMLAALEATIPATAREELRPVMNCVALDMKDGKLICVASDTHILTVREASVIRASQNDSTCLLHYEPASIVKELIRDASKVMVILGKKDIEINTGLSSIRVIQTQGTYPNWRSIIPKESAGSFTVDRQQLLSALKRMGSITDAAARRVAIYVRDGKLMIESKDLTKSTNAKETMEATLEGDTSVRLCFSLPFMETILSSMKCASVKILYTDGTHAAKAESADEDKDNGFSIIMPTIESA